MTTTTTTPTPRNKGREAQFPHSEDPDPTSNEQALPELGAKKPGLPGFNFFFLSLFNSLCVRARARMSLSLSPESPVGLGWGGNTR